VSEPVFPRLVRFLQALGWIRPQQTRKPISKKTPKGKALHIDPYDFSDGSVPLQQLVSEISTGELPTPAPSRWQPDFSAGSPEEALRRLTERMGLRSRAGVPVSLEQCLKGPDLGGHYYRPPTAGITPASNVEPLTPEDEKFRANFGCEGTTKRKKVFRTLTEEEKQRLDPRKIDNYYFGADFEAIRPRIREKTPYLSHDHMMLGDRYFQRQPETKEPTIKDKWETTEKWQERYWFGT